MSASAIEAGKAIVRVTLESDVDRGIADVRAQLKSLSRGFSEVGLQVVKVGALITGLFGSALAALSFPVQISAQIQDAQVSFEALTGSVAAANTIIQELRLFAARTPLTFTGLAKTTGQLLAYGRASSEVTDDIKALSAVARGNEVTLERLALAYGQTAAKSRLYATEIRQFTESGFSPLQAIAAATGESLAEVDARVTAGAVSFGELRDALFATTQEGGRFFGLLEKRSKTINGVFIRLRDSFAIAIEPIGKAISDAIIPFIQGLTDVINALAPVIEANKQFGVVLGAVALGGTAAGIAITGLGLAMLGIGSGLRVLEAVVEAGNSVRKAFSQDTGAVKISKDLQNVTDKAAEISNAITLSSREAIANLGSLGRAVLGLEKTFLKATTRIANAGKAMVSGITKAANSAAVGYGKAAVKFSAASKRIEKSINFAALSPGVLSAAFGKAEIAIAASLVGISTASAAMAAQVAGNMAVAATSVNVLTSQVAGTAAGIAGASAAQKASAGGAAAAVAKATSRVKKSASEAAKAVTAIVPSDIKPDAKAFDSLDSLISNAISNTIVPQKVPTDELTNLINAGLAGVKVNVKPLEQTFSSLDDVLKAGLVIPPELRTAPDKVYNSLDDLIRAGESFDPAPAKRKLNAFFQGFIDEAEAGADAIEAAANEIHLRPIDDDILDIVFGKKQTKSTFAQNLLTQAESAIDDVAVKASRKAARAANFVSPFASEMAAFSDSLAIRPPKIFTVVADSAKRASKSVGESAAFVASSFANVGSGLGKGVAKATSVVATPLKGVGGLLAAGFAPLVSASGPLVAVATAIGQVALALTGVVAIVAAVAGSVAFLLNRAGLLEPILSGIAGKFQAVFNFVKSVLGGVIGAIRIGEYQKAFDIILAAGRLAFFTLVDEAFKGFVYLASNGLEIFLKFGKAVFDTIIDIGKNIPKLLYAVIFQGGEVAAKAIADLISGNLNDGFISNSRESAAADLEALLTDTNRLVAKKDKERSDAAAIEAGKREEIRQKELNKEKEAAAEAAAAKAFDAQQKRNVGLLASGVAEVALRLSDEDIQKANESSKDRQVGLRGEIIELLRGKEAMEEFKAATTGVSAANYVLEKQLRRQQSVLTEGTAIKDRIKDLQLEAVELNLGAAAARAAEFAQKGYNKELGALFEQSQRSEAFVEFQKRVRDLQDELTSATLGEDALLRQQLAREGLNAAEIKAVLVMQQRVKATEEQNEVNKQLIEDAKDVKKAVRTPFEAFREEQARLIDLQQRGLISQSDAGKAYTANIAKLRDEVNKEFEQFKVGGDNSAESIKRARADMVRALQSRQGGFIAQQIAAGPNASNEAALRVNAQFQKQQQADQKFKNDNLSLLQSISKGVNNPKVIISIK